jgi:3-oxoadipate enol-lactonase
LWQAPVNALRAEAHTVAIDGPSQGRSEAIRWAFTLEQCADAWVEALDVLGLRQPAVFCGLSWGSMVAMRVAIRHPARVRALGPN